MNHHQRTSIWRVCTSIWAILRAPLTVPLPKVAPLVLESLISLHNYCIDENETDSIEIRSRNYATNLDRTVHLSREVGGGRGSSMVDFDDDGRPVSLLGHGHHFTDAEQYRYDRSLESIRTPMDDMIASCEEQDLTRPRY